MADDKKGGAKSEAGQLFIDFGAKGLGKLIKGLNSLSASFLLTKNGAEQALKPIISMSQNAGKAVTNWDKLNTVTGISIKQLQRMQVWSDLNNVSFSEMMGQVQTLQKNLYAIFRSGGNSTGFSLLGIDPRSLDINKPIEALDAILERASQIAKTQPAIAANALEELGLSRDLLYAYKQQNTAIDERLMLNDNEIASLKNQQTGWNTLKVTADTALQKFIADQTWLNSALMKCSEYLTQLVFKIGDLRKVFDEFKQSDGYLALKLLFDTLKLLVAGASRGYNLIRKHVGEPLAELQLKGAERVTSVKKGRLLVDPIALTKYELLMNKKNEELKKEQEKYLATHKQNINSSTGNKKINNSSVKSVAKQNISSPFNLEPINDVPTSINPILPPLPAVPATGNNNNVNITINQDITAPSPEEAGKKSAINIQDNVNEILERQNLAGL